MKPVHRVTRRIATLLVLVACGATSAAVTAQVPPAGPPTPVCGPCLTSHFKAFNRCTWWSIDTDGINCPDVEIGGLFRLDSTTKRASLRFTLSQTLVGPQTMTSVWLYSRTRGTWPIADWVLLVCADNNKGQPGAVLNTTLFQPLQPGGTKDWQNIQLSSPVTGLQPGSIYHLVVQPSSAATAAKWIELVTARGRFPVRFTPTDALGTAATSPCDRWLGIMLADSSHGPVPGSDYYVLEANNNVGYTPIFAVELQGVGLFGQPFNEHIEKTIVGTSEYGERITLAASTQLNYAAFFTRAEGCPGDPSPQLLRFRVLDGSQNQVIPPTGSPTLFIPATQFYFGRSHWFGVFFDPIVLPAGVYYLVLSAPDPAPGWVFSAENSTMPLSAALIPTYLRDTAYAVQNTGPGGSFVRLSTKADAGFLLGYYSSGKQEIGNLCDSGVTVSGCGNTYAKTAMPGDMLLFLASSLNIGDMAPPSGNLQYMRLLDFDCLPLSPPTYCTISGPVGPGKHAGGPAISWTWPTTWTGDAFLWWEFGHQDPLNTLNLITDELEPIEIRNLCNPCTCPP